MKNNLGLLRKLSILATLLFCLSWIGFSTDTQSAAALRPCCSECPVPPGDLTTTPQAYCQDQCGATSGSCYSACIIEVNNCQHWCLIGC